MSPEFTVTGRGSIADDLFRNRRGRERLLGLRDFCHVPKSRNFAQCGDTGQRTRGVSADGVTVSRRTNRYLSCTSPPWLHILDSTQSRAAKNQRRSVSRRGKWKGGACTPPTRVRYGHLVSFDTRHCGLSSFRWRYCRLPSVWRVARSRLLSLKRLRRRRSAPFPQARHRSSRAQARH
jgi:hypothetical protein